MTKFQSLFSPLDRTYCSYFLYLSMFGVFFTTIMLFFFLYCLLIKKDIIVCFNAFMMCLIYGTFYLQSRLLYSMCLGSLDA